MLPKPWRITSSSAIPRQIRKIFGALFLDVRNHLISEIEIFRGTLFLPRTLSGRNLGNFGPLSHEI